MRKKFATCFFCFLFLPAAFAFRAAAQTSEPAIPAQPDLTSTLKDISRLSSVQKNMVLSVTGMPQGNNFEMGKMIAYLLFPAIGFVAFIYGKKESVLRPMIIGVALMAYPYFIAATWAIYGIGLGLCAALYFWRE